MSKRVKKIHLIEYPFNYNGRTRIRDINSVCGRPISMSQRKADRRENIPHRLISKTTCLACLKGQVKREQGFINMMLKVVAGRVDRRLDVENRIDDLRKEG